MKKITNIVLTVLMITIVPVSACLGASKAPFKKGYVLLRISQAAKGIVINSVNHPKNIGLLQEESCSLASRKQSLNHITVDSKNSRYIIANLKAKMGLALQNQFKATILSDKQQALKLMEACQNTDSLQENGQNKQAHYILKEVLFYQIGNTTKYSTTGARLVESNEENKATIALVSAQF